MVPRTRRPSSSPFTKKKNHLSWWDRLDPPARKGPRARRDRSDRQVQPDQQVQQVPTVRQDQRDPQAPLVPRARRDWLGHQVRWDPRDRRAQRDLKASPDHRDRLARLARLDMIGEVFLAEYEKHAPIARQRVALWEAWSYLRDALHFWTKVKPAEPDNGLLMLESHLRDMGLYESAQGGDAGKPSKSVSTPKFRYIAMAYAVIASTWVDELAETLGFLQSMI